MKSVIALIIGSTSADFSNSVPLLPTRPGWHLGNPNGTIELRLLYDLFCPDSMASHYTWKTLFEKDVQVDGHTMKWKDVVNMSVTPFVLPYHMHSFQATQVYIYLEDLCASDSTRCL